MTRGYPDYSPGAARSKEGLFTPLLAEAPIWFKDDFSNPAPKWVATGATQTIITTRAVGAITNPVFEGDGAMRMVQTGAGSAIARTDFGAMPIIGRVGFEVVFLIPDSTGYTDIENSFVPIEVRWQTSSLLRFAIVGYNPTDKKWYISTDGKVTWTLLGAYDINDNSWHIVKLVIDPSTNKYVTLYVDTKEFDISAYDYYTEIGAVSAYVRFRIEALPFLAHTPEYYIGRVIITYGET